MSINKNTTLRWVNSVMKEKIIIEDEIINSKIRGVYGIFVESEKEKRCVYVGRATNIYARLFIGNDAHLVKLKKGKHDNTELQKAMCKSSDKIIIEILEKVCCEYDDYYKDMQKLASRECHYIDKYQKINQCLEQLPDGSNMKEDIWRGEKESHDQKLNNCH